MLPTLPNENNLGDVLVLLPWLVQSQPLGGREAKVHGEKSTNGPTGQSLVRLSDHPALTTRLSGYPLAP